MLAETERKLLLTNFAVFVCVIGALSLAIYAYFVDSLYSQARNELIKLADSAISSIDFDSHAIDDAGKPDLIVSALPDSASKSLMDIKLEWFEPNGRLSAQKGNFPVSVSLSKNAAFQVQTSPHALLLTKPAILDGRILGYVRVAHPLHVTDEVIHRLTIGLVLGLLIGAVASGTGINLLVRQSMKPIEKSVKKLKKFTADASHEFSSPIMAIKSNSEVALKYSEGMRPKDREKFQHILNASEQLVKLSSDLLELAQLDSIETFSAQTNSDISAILNNILSELSEDESDRVILKAPPLLIVTADNNHLKRIFSNIISNALYYTPDKGLVVITAAEADQSVIVAVKDNGIGIDSADLDKVFDRFWRADLARSKRNTGQGLGLSIAKALVETYHGDITVESLIGQGSTFTVSIPRAPTSTKPNRRRFFGNAIKTRSHD